jgi:hypothetical protein
MMHRVAGDDAAEAFAFALAWPLGNDRNRRCIGWTAQIHCLAPSIPCISDTASNNGFQFQMTRAWSQYGGRDRIDVSQDSCHGRVAPEAQRLIERALDLHQRRPDCPEREGMPRQDGPRTARDERCDRGEEGDLNFHVHCFASAWPR